MRKLIQVKGKFKVLTGFRLDNVMDNSIVGLVSEPQVAEPQVYAEWKLPLRFHAAGLASKEPRCP